ncbi:hypothetical protein RBSWK_04328 [Rhodopirellula baltica SWK14]|uniref:Uncharacterized protein n=1 Tax=Rhodopirellula baltica SWK14 TaxID=993516 RepID=L7CDW9_RHOBT|nr:hypothetical protein RBSWK_04328 [Rhodopirellula baltica SWK14]
MRKQREFLAGRWGDESACKSTPVERFAAKIGRSWADVAGSTQIFVLSFNDG